MNCTHIDIVENHWLILVSMQRNVTKVVVIVRYVILIQCREKLTFRVRVSVVEGALNLVLTLRFLIEIWIFPLRNRWRVKRRNEKLFVKLVFLTINSLSVL